MDLSKLSIDDLKALRDGNLGNVSGEGMKILAAQQGRKSAPQVIDNINLDPTAGMSGTEKFLAGVGKAMVDTGRGVGQMVGLVDRKDVAESRKRDAALMNTTEGSVGNVAGNVATLLPTAFIPGANTYTGAALLGAATGLLQPSTSTGETLSNVGMGAALSPAALAAGRAVGGLVQGGKALVEPFTKKGQDAIAGRTLQNFAGGGANAAQASAAMSAARPMVPGVQPTIGATSQNAGIAQLERTLRNNPQLTQNFFSRDQANRNALLDSLRGIAGDAGEREFYAAQRAATAQQMYNDAFSNYSDANLTPWVKGQITQLLKRPSIDQASRTAQRWAIERGEQPAAAGSLRALHDVKMALDDMISDAVQKGAGGEVAALKTTQSQLLNVMDKLSPDYAAARVTYQQMSQPINRMDVGQRLYDSLAPALSDFGQSSSLTPAKYASALRDANATAAKATGFPSAKMDSIMNPQDMATIQGVGEELARMSNAQNMGRAVGSNTGQNLVSQNFLRQLLGPTGLPESWAESTLLQSVMRPAQFAARLGEGRILNRLADAALDPKDAASLLIQVQQPSAMAAIGNRLMPYLPGAGSVPLNSLLGNRPQQ